MKEVVTFFLSGKEYGADVSEIQGIENYVEYAKEPGLSDGFLGIVSILSLIHISEPTRP